MRVAWVGVAICLSGSWLGAEPAVRISPSGHVALSPTYAVGLNGTAVFSLRDQAGHFGVWASDGTPGGTKLLLESDYLDGRWSAVMDGSLYFKGPGSAVWRTDGTPEGTHPFIANQGWGDIGFLAASNGRVWVLSNNKLWRSDGTPSGTTCIQAPYLPDNLLALDDLAIFTSAGTGRLMRSDGTATGTYAVGYDAWAGFSFPFGPYCPAPMGSGVYFPGGPYEGSQLWRTEGSVENTGMVADVAATQRRGTPYALTPVAGRLFFTLAGSSAPGLWTSDGTTEGTVFVTALPGRVQDMLSSGPVAYFALTIVGSSGGSLWRSDGTPQGTFALIESLQGSQPFFTSYRVGDAGGRLVFGACDEEAGCEPWISDDGTLAGTRRLADVTPGPASSNPGRFTFAGDHVFFDAGGAIWSIALPARDVLDFDRDGYGDLCWQSADDKLSTWRMRGTAALERGPIQPESPPSGARLAACADLDDDGAADLLFRDVATGLLQAWSMRGRQRIQEHVLPYLQPPDRDLAGVGDLDGDSHNDILWHDADNGDVSAWLMNGLERRAVASLTPSRVGDTRWRPVGLGDFDADGQTDLLWQHAASRRLVVWLMKGLQRREGMFLTPSEEVGSEWQVQAVQDLDSDGDADIVWRSASSQELLAWLMGGTTRRERRRLSPSMAP